MNTVAYLHFIAFCIYISLIYFTARKGMGSQINRAFILLLTALALLSFSQYFVHNIFVPKKIALIFMDISAVGWAPIAAVFVWFVGIATRKITVSSKRGLIFIIFFPALFFIYLQFSHRLVVGLNKEYFGWGVIWTDGIWFYVYWAYAFIYASIGFLLLLRFYRRATEHFEKKASFLMLTFTWPTLSALFIFDGLLPKLGIRILPEMTNLICVFWTTGLTYIIVRYNFILITPTMAAADIIKTMRDSLILLTGTKRIVEVNQYTLNLLGYDRREDLLDKDIGVIFPESGSNPFSGAGFESLLNEGVLNAHNVFFRTSSGNNIPVSLTAVVRYDNYKRAEGVIIIARDIREILDLYHKEKELATMTVRAEVESKKAGELKKAYDELTETQDMLVKSEKMRTVGLLGTTIVKEMSKPVNGIIGMLREEIQEAEKGIIDPSKLRNIELRCLYLQKLMEDFRNYAIESVEKIGNIDLREILEATIDLMKFKLNNEGILVERTYEDELPRIKGDRRHVQQVLINLLTSSLDGLKKGGVLKIGTRVVDIDNKKHIDAYFGEPFDISVERNDIEASGDFTSAYLENKCGLSMTINYLVIRTQGGRLLVYDHGGKNVSYVVRFPAK